MVDTFFSPVSGYEFEDSVCKFSIDDPADEYLVWIVCL